MRATALLFCVGLAAACQCGQAPTDAAPDAGHAATPDATVAPGDGGDGAGSDAAATPDGAVPDAAVDPFDAAVPDASAGQDAASIPDASIPDATPPPDAAMGTPDAGPPDAGPIHVHIFIDSTCQVSIDPEEVTVPADVLQRFSFHNHSTFYEADVWMSYGGGFLELARGATWHDPINHCLGPNPHLEFADISIAGGGSSSCPEVRFRIHCQ